MEPFIDFPSSQTYTGCMSVCGGGRGPMNYQTALDSCLVGSDDIISIDEVSGNSPMAANSTRYSTGEYPLLNKGKKKVCYVSVGTLKTESMSRKEKKRYSFFTSCARKVEAT